MRLSFIVGFLFCVQIACATPPPHTIKEGELYLGSTLESVEPAHVFSRVRPGDVIIVSENHGYGPHHAHQRQAIAMLSQAWPQTPVSVGMEFFDYPDQA